MKNNDDYTKFLRVIANTDDYLVIHKEPGIPFHATGKSEGILQIVRRLEAEGVIVPGPRLYPVHRLDQIASGILLFARGRKNANLFSNEFRHHRAEKCYVALSERRPKKKQGRIAGDMTRGRRGSWILTRENKNPAITNFTSHSIPGRRPGLRLYDLRPKTGRTHQLRVAMKSLGAPILGDGLYGRHDLAREEDRAYLHARGLRVRFGETTLTFLSEPSPGIEFASPEFKKALAALGDPFGA